MKITRLVILLVLLALAAACGNKGSLVRPVPDKVAAQS
jgi:predicted small lipoprotein YifL